MNRAGGYVCRGVSIRFGCRVVEDIYLDAS